MLLAATHPSIALLFLLILWSKRKTKVSYYKKITLSLLRANFAIGIFYLCDSTCIKGPPFSCQSSFYLEPKWSVMWYRLPGFGKGFDIASAGKNVSFPTWVLPTSESTLPISLLCIPSTLAVFQLQIFCFPLALSFSFLFVPINTTDLLPWSSIAVYCLWKYLPNGWSQTRPGLQWHISA